MMPTRRLLSPAISCSFCNVDMTESRYTDGETVVSQKLLPFADNLLLLAIFLLILYLWASKKTIIEKQLVYETNNANTTRLDRKSDL